MREYKLYRVTIKPKHEGGDVFSFRFVAENPKDAMTKCMALPDFDYMYDESAGDSIIVEFDGIVY